MSAKESDDQNMIDKWDGKLPIYGTTPTLFRDLGK
jgi:hypothetical protein